MAYITLKEIYSKAKDKLGYFVNSFNNKPNPSYLESNQEELTKARIAVLLGRCVEDLDEKIPTEVKESALEGKVKTAI